MVGLNFFQHHHSYVMSTDSSFLARTLPLASLSGNPSRPGFPKPGMFGPGSSSLLYTGAFFCLKFHPFCKYFLCLRKPGTL